MSLSLRQGVIGPTVLLHRQARSNVVTLPPPLLTVGRNLLPGPSIGNGPLLPADGHLSLLSTTFKNDFFSFFSHGDALVSLSTSAGPCPPASACLFPLLRPETKTRPPPPTGPSEGFWLLVSSVAFLPAKRKAGLFFSLLDLTSLVSG